MSCMKFKVGRLCIFNLPVHPVQRRLRRGLSNPRRIPLQSVRFFDSLPVFGNLLGVLYLVLCYLRYGFVKGSVSDLQIFAQLSDKRSRLPL